MKYDLRVSDVWLRVMHNKIHKHMNLVCDASGTRKVRQTHSNPAVTKDCSPMLLTSQTDIDFSPLRLHTITVKHTSNEFYLNFVH
jgi:hypothetical protein